MKSDHYLRALESLTSALTEAKAAFMSLAPALETLDRLTVHLPKSVLREIQIAYVKADPPLPEQVRVTFCEAMRESL